LLISNYIWLFGNIWLLADRGLGEGARRSIYRHLLDGLQSGQRPCQQCHSCVFTSVGSRHCEHHGWCHRHVRTQRFHYRPVLLQVEKSKR